MLRELGQQPDGTYDSQAGWDRFLEWQHFGRLNPPEKDRLGPLFASLEACLTNIHRNTERYPEPFPYKNFLLYFGDEFEVTRPTNNLSQEEQGKRLRAAFLSRVGLSEEEFQKRMSEQGAATNAKIERDVLESMELEIGEEIPEEFKRARPLDALESLEL